MPDTIERTIYKLEIDDSGYIRGVENMSASTKRLAEIQQKANDTLRTNEVALKSASDFLAKAKKDLDSYTGSDQRYRQQLQKDFERAQVDQKKLLDLVKQNRIAYDEATKAAQEFAETSAKATKLQQQTTGGKIPIPTLTTPIQPLPKINFQDFSGLPNILATVKGEFDNLRKSIDQAKASMIGLDEESDDFKRLSEFVRVGEEALQRYDHAVELASESTTELSQRIQGAQETLSKINTTSVEQLPVEIAKSTKQFEDLEIAVSIAEERLKQMNPEDSGFADLAKFVAQGKTTLEQYDTAAKNVTGSQASLRTQLRLAREELVRLEQAGKGASQEYLELEKRTAKLTDQFNDQQQRIRILASDTKLLDFGKGAITAATSAFQTYTSVAILVGNQSEDLQKKTMQLFAAMQLLQSLEQLSNLTRREGILSVLGLSAATKVYNAVVGQSTGLLKAFRIALLGTGIGIAIATIGFLVSRFIQHREALKRAAEEQKLYNDVVEEGNKEAGKQIATLKLLTQAARDTALPLKERLAAVKELQKEFPDYFGNLSKEAILTGDITRETDALTKSIRAAATARAAKGKIDAIEAQRLDLEFQKQKVINATAAEAARVKAPQAEQKVIPTGGGAPIIIRPETIEEQKAVIEARKQNALDDIKDKDEALQRQEDFLVKFAGLGNIAKTVEEDDKKKKEKTKAEKKQVENEFLERKAELDKQLAELTRKEADNESKIRVEFAARLQKELLDIDKALKEKKLTKPQAETLKIEAVQINTEQIKQALDKLNKDSIAARQKLNDELNNLQQKANQDALNLLQDEFDKRAKLIDFNEQKELADSKEATEERLKNLDLERLLIGEEEYQRARQVIVSTGELEVNNIIRKAAQDRQDLSADIFKKSLENYEKAITAGDLVRDQDLNAEITKQSERFLKGKISFETFQKNITKFQREQEAQRRAGEIQVLEDELADLDHHLAAVKDTNSKEYQDTKETRDKIAGIVVQKKTENVTKNVEEKNSDTDERTQQVLDYTNAVGELASAVIGFWQTANEAERAALDRSISIQEERVNAAQRIAERGNASYLKQETDRLKQLQIARENAARRDLAINAALQASQLLVGITGAIAKIASGIGAAETIAEIAIIVGALATGYGLVKSLQGNQPRLKAGTTYVERGRNKQGIDTIPAWLTEGEAVIPAAKNRNYKKSVEAIYHEKIPAEVLNQFVEEYVTKNVRKRKETETTTDNVSIYKNFVSNISEVPPKVLNNFISSYKKEKPKKLFRGTPEVKADVPAWLTEGEAIIPKVQNKKYKNSVGAIYDERIPADVLNEFVQNYVEIKKYNEPKVSKTDISKPVTNIITENKPVTTYQNFVENISKTPSAVLNKFIERYVKEKSLLSSLIENYEYKVVDKQKEISLFDTNTLNNEKEVLLKTLIEKDSSSKETTTDKSSVNSLIDRLYSNTNEKNVLKTLVEKYGHTSDKVSKVSFSDKKIIENFISKEKEKEVNKLVKEVYSNNNIQAKGEYKKVIESIYNSNISTENLTKFIKNVSTSRTEFVENLSKINHEAINNFIQNQSYSTKNIDSFTRNTSNVNDHSISNKSFNEFVNTYHKVNPLPIPNYERIKQVNEIKMSHDGKMAGLLDEQNRLLRENNDLQKQTHRALKSMGINVNMDKDGIAISVMEATEQIKKNKKL